MRRTTLRLLGAVAIALTSLTAATAAHSATSSPQLGYIAHLRLHIVTTSSATTVNISPGGFAVARFSGQTGSGTWQSNQWAVSLSGAAATGTKSVTADLIYQDPTTDPSVHFGLRKASGGQTQVTIATVPDTTAQQIGTMVDNPPQTYDPVSTAYARSSVMGAHPPQIPRVDARRLVLALYYPWFSAYTDPRLADRPSQPRSNFTAAGVNSMTAQAKANGIDGFVVSWAGEHNDGPQFRLALQAAQTNGQVITGYLESDQAADHAGEAAEVQWLAELLHYSNNPAFLKSQSGVPVVFVYHMSRFTPAQWQDIVHQVWVNYHFEVHLIGDSTDPAYLPQEWGLHTYAATGPVSGMLSYAIANGLATRGTAMLYPNAAKRLFVGTVTPGYDDHLLRGSQDPVISRNGGQRYFDSWNAARVGQPDWILVTSWNEWYEDTEVEPGVATGSMALAQTQQQAAQWKAN